MRVRNKPWADALINSHPDLVINNKEKQIHDLNFIKQDKPLHVEIGSGKGDFLIGMALKHPDIEFIGIEIQKSVLAIALKKTLQQKITNLHWIWSDGSAITDIFVNQKIDFIYLNFSDPWPKKRHEKRRLTYIKFLQEYKNVLKDDGYLQLKTDNRHFFEYSLLSITNFGFSLKEISLDWHKDVIDNDLENIETEHEHKFSQRGQVIYRLLIKNFK